MDDDDARDDLKVEELSLEDLRGSKGEKEEGGKEPGGFRAGGLGPEGSTYKPPEGKRRSTWKPLAVAVMLLIGAFFGIFTIGDMLTLESQAEGNEYILRGQVVDYDEAMEKRDVPIAGVNVTVDGMDLSVVTDEEGIFTYPDIPGGKFRILFYKRSWDEAINTEYISIMAVDYDGDDDPAKFMVKVTDLAPDRSRPVYDGTHSVNAEVLDWPTNTTATLRIHTSAFDEDLSTHRIEMSVDKETWFDKGPYANIVNYDFAAGSDQSMLSIKVVRPNNTVHASTDLTIPVHPAGPGGWESTDHPQVALFVRGGPFTNGEDRRVVVHSNDATGYTYRNNGGEWVEWATLEDGHGEFVWTPELPLRGSVVESHAFEVMTRNATGVNGTPASVTITLDTIPSILGPKSTRGVAVTDEATFDPNGNDSPFIRYSLPDGTWSPWQMHIDEVMVPISDEGDEATVTFEGRDRAGNNATADGTVAIKHQKVFEVDAYGVFYDNLMVCIPIKILGILLALFGGYMAYRRRRPTMVMLGAVGALLASYGYAGSWGLIGPLIAAAALMFVMLSRDEFDQPDPEPEE